LTSAKYAFAWDNVSPKLVKTASSLSESNLKSLKL
jgi:hypothetical protein